jgi:hypothetical protein
MGSVSCRFMDLDNCPHVFTGAVVHVLFQLLENYMQRTKKKLADDKLQTFKTGGGTFIRQIDDLDLKLMSLMGYRATPLPNPYDADAAYNDKGISNFLVILRDVTGTICLTLYLYVYFSLPIGFFTHVTLQLHCVKYYLAFKKSITLLGVDQL